MIRLDMEKPKNCISCPFKEAFFEHVSTILYCTAADKRRIGGAKVAHSGTPDWCPLMEEKHG